MARRDSSDGPKTNVTKFRHLMYTSSVQQNETLGQINESLLHLQRLQKKEQKLQLGKKASQVSFKIIEH